MTGSSHRSAGPQLRRGFILLALLGGGMAILSFFGGRPGDFAGGLLGAIIGGFAATIVVIVELIGRRLARNLSNANSKSGDEQSAAAADRSRD